MERFREAAQMFLGKHDFRTFLTINNDTHVSYIFLNFFIFVMQKLYKQQKNIA